MSRFRALRRAFVTLSVALHAGAAGAQQTPPVSAGAAAQLPPRVGITAVRQLSVSEAVNEALMNNPDVVVARTTVEQAGYGAAGALGAFDPQVGLDSSYQRQVVPVSSIIGGAASGRLTQQDLLFGPRIQGISPAFGTNYQLSFSSRRQTSDNTFTTLNPQFPTALAFNITQPLFRGRAVDEPRRRVELANRNQSLTESQFRQRVMDVALQTELAYADLVFADQNLRVQLEGLDLAQQQVASNQRLVDQGVGAPIDVVEAQTQVASVRQSVAAAQTQLTRAENALKLLISNDRSAPVWAAALQPSPGTLATDTVLSLDDSVRQALSQRPELQQSAIALETNTINTRFFRDQTKPQVDLIANYTSSGLAGRVIPSGPNPFLTGFVSLFERINALSAAQGLDPIGGLDGVGGEGASNVPALLNGSVGQSLTNLITQDFPTFQVGLRLSLPLHDRTAQANLASSLVEGRRLQVQRQQLEGAIEADVRNALQNVESLRASAAAAAEVRDLAEQQYASEQRRFEAGTSTVFFVVQRQSALISARSQQARVQADLDKSLAILRRAVGRTAEAHGITFQSK